MFTNFSKIRIFFSLLWILKLLSEFIFSSLCPFFILTNHIFSWLGNSSLEKSLSVSIKMLSVSIFFLILYLQEQKKQNIEITDNQNCSKLLNKKLYQQLSSFLYMLITTRCREQKLSDVSQSWKKFLNTAVFKIFRIKNAVIISCSLPVWVIFNKLRTSLSNFWKEIQMVDNSPITSEITKQFEKIQKVQLRFRCQFHYYGTNSP